MGAFQLKRDLRVKTRAGSAEHERDGENLSVDSSFLQKRLSRIRTTSTLGLQFQLLTSVVAALQKLMSQ